MGDDLDAEDDDIMEIEKTPTKARPRAKAAARIDPLPTPPPSSPTEMTEAVKRMELVRMQSDASITTNTSITSDDTRPGNPYKYLKSFLRLSSSSNANASNEASSASDEIIGRAPEKHLLKTYLSSVEREVGMYISGPPGTGKTALVTAMGRDLGRQKWNTVELGCMGLKTSDMWKRLAEGLGLGSGGTETEVMSHLESAKNTYVSQFKSKISRI